MIFLYNSHLFKLLTTNQILLLDIILLISSYPHSYILHHPPLLSLPNLDTIIYLFIYLLCLFI